VLHKNVFSMNKYETTTLFINYVLETLWNLGTVEPRLTVNRGTRALTDNQKDG